VLRQISQQQNRNLRDVAIEIVTTISGQPPSSSPFDLPQPRT
jgi:hypothetical protein